MIHHRRAVLPLAAGILALAASLTGEETGDWPAPDPERTRKPDDTRPNVVLILADDLGYGDLGCYGSKDLETPHLDALAARGMRFTAAYVGGPVCGPSRACLLTGRYQNRYGFELNWDNVLPPMQPSIAEMLRATGYTTGLLGKWHVGHTADTNPLARGFDEFYGRLGGIFNYLPTEKKPEPKMLRGHRELHAAKEGYQLKKWWHRGIVDEPIDGYTTDRFNAEAVSFIERHADEPFFLFVSHHAPHSPLQCIPRYTERYPEGHFATWGERAARRRTYAGMVAALDDGVGMITEALERHGLADETLVIFLSDNGGTDRFLGCNAPLKGGKGTLWEGGIRIPWIVAWPGGKVPAGETSDQAICALDLWPTLRNLAGGKDDYLRGPDGVDLLPAFTGGELADRPLVWRYGLERAVRRGRWKYYQKGEGAARLYDVVADPGETTDLAVAQPEVLAGLVRDFDAWEVMMAPPAWGRPERLEAIEEHFRRRRGPGVGE